jgi:tRNA(Ile2) C34 agmatinyltransferase TiaS
MDLQKVYRKYEETFAYYYRRARGLQRTLKDSGYETEEATFCTIVYQGICPNDIRDPLLATIKADDLSYSDVEERLHQLDTMYPLKLYPKKNKGQSSNRRCSWRQESRGSYRGYQCARG